MQNKLNFIFFGSSSFSVDILECLKNANRLPLLIVTMPDAPKGRGLVLTPPAVKIWAEKNNIPVLQPTKLDQEFMRVLSKAAAELYVIASYGKIVPQTVLDVPSRGTINVHPSLLPKYRGPTPIPSQILADESEVGVTIMGIDALVDHGPIYMQKEIIPLEWPMKVSILRSVLSKAGGELLNEVMDQIENGTAHGEEQVHDKATFTKKIVKEDGKLDLAADGYANYLKFCAYEDSVGTFFFTQKKGKDIRVKIVDAEYAGGVFLPLRVIPEGGKEMSYTDFLRGLV